MRCEHPAYANKKLGTESKYKCILEHNHKGNHTYLINGKKVQLSGCCPEGQIADYEIVKDYGK